MDSNKVRKNQNQTTCILKACDYLIDLSIHISNFKNIAKPPQTSILNAHWQSVTLVSMKTLDTPLVQSPSLLQLSPLGETGCTHDLHCDTSEFATFLEKVGMLTSWWCVVISVFLFLRLFPLRTHTPWRWQESICCHCPNHCVILQKRFRICKDRLFSASCLKDARIWNEALGNNFKEAHVFCFHFFPPSIAYEDLSGGTFGASAFAESYCRRNNSHKVNGLWKVSKTQNNCLIDSFPKAILAIGYIYCFAFAWCSLEGLCMELLWYLGPCDIVQPYLPLSRVRTFPTIDFCLQCVDSERWM